MMNKKIKKFNKTLQKSKKILFALVIFCAVLFVKNPSYSAEEFSKAFNLITVVDNFLNLEGDSKSAYDSLDEKARQRQEFIETTRRFNQGNVSVAYNDYSKIISEMDNDIALLIFSKSMYKIGFFTLGDVAISKIKNQTYFSKQIEVCGKMLAEKFNPGMAMDCIAATYFLHGEDEAKNLLNSYLNKYPDDEILKLIERDWNENIINFEYLSHLHDYYEIMHEFMQQPSAKSNSQKTI